MSEREKTMVEKIAKLPPELQTRFVDKLDGAIMAMDLTESKREGADNAKDKV